LIAKSEALFRTTQSDNDFCDEPFAVGATAGVRADAALIIRVVPQSEPGKEAADLHGLAKSLGFDH
jgi:hypothetical protein